jgi:hypothetical protein
MLTSEAINFSDTSNFKIENDVVMIFHTLMSNIFMLNYLIAILTTVYEEMLQ